jgi:hypothetical protein
MRVEYVARAGGRVGQCDAVWCGWTSLGAIAACLTANAADALGAGLLAALCLCVEQSFARRPEPRERLVDGLTHYVGAHSDVLIGQEVAHVEHISHRYKAPGEPVAGAVHRSSAGAAEPAPPSEATRLKIVSRTWFHVPDGAAGCRVSSRSKAQPWAVGTHSGISPWCR